MRGANSALLRHSPAQRFKPGPPRSILVAVNQHAAGDAQSYPSSHRDARSATKVARSGALHRARQGQP
jgi:hypothetical protein